MIVRPLVVAVALACIVALVAKTALHYVLRGDKRGRRRLIQGRTTTLFREQRREKREEELDEDEPGYAAFLKSDGYEENVMTLSGGYPGQGG